MVSAPELPELSDVRVRTALALVRTGRCLLCGRWPAGGAVLYLPADPTASRKAYALCHRCHRRDGWERRAEAALFGGTT